MQTYLVYAIAGSLLMLVSILAIKPLSGATSYLFSDLMAATPNLPVQTQIWIFLGFTAAFAAKLPLVPLHGWLIGFHTQNHESGVADVAKRTALTLSVASKLNKLRARIGPLSRADKQLLWKKESFLSKFLSISPYTCLKKEVSGTKTGVLNGPVLEKPTTNRV